MRRFFVLLAAGLFLCSISYAQDQPAQDQPSGAQDPPPPAPTLSLGEIARQVKLKKQQREAQLKAKEAATHDAQASDATPAPPAKTAHLVTNDDAPERATVTPVSTHAASPVPSEPQTDTGDHQAKAENWKSQILAQKHALAQLQQEVKSLSDSIHFAGGNCIANCAQWNERQQQKQQEVDTMKAQFEEQQKALEEMQEAARKEGFGSSVYDP
jgi:DNA repair exonuclease SbcCD ATPase subunit